MTPKDPYDALLLVANWPESRVDAWTTLLRARAMENQCYVAGVNRVGVDGFKVPHSGQSQLIGPEGGSLDSGRHASAAGASRNLVVPQAEGSAQALPLFSMTATPSPWTDQGSIDPLVVDMPIGADFHIGPTKDLIADFSCPI